ncbi:hypothetical protein EDD86DRAFT_219431 [Gorgonomyces haynaldii]|nr:hypothetical protein EDD86DRAFT_219431 [Gorgonomyces haynaldii]
MKSSKSLLVASKTQLSMSKKSSFGSSTKVMSPTMGRSPTLVSPLKVTNALDSISGSDESVKKGIKLSSTEPNLDLKLKRRQTDPVKRKYPEASLPIGSMDSLSSEVDKAKEVDMKTRHEAFTNRTSTEDSIMIIVSQEGKITRTDTITTRRRFLAEQPSFIGAEVDPLMVLPRRLTEASVECSDSDILIDQVDPTPISPIENLLV